MPRSIDGFWWTWREGDDWPSWYYNEDVARSAADKLARESPGRKIYVGDLRVAAKRMLPADIIEVK